MNKVKRKFKKGAAILLTLVLLIGILPIMPNDISTVSAAGGNSGNTPSVTAYATKNELMNTFQQDGNNTTIGKIVFGKDYNGSPLEWYILGQDSGVTGENISVFAASSIAIGQKFNSSNDNKTYNYTAGTGYGETNGSIEVYANHYGASELRAKLQELATNADYFTTAEQNLMQATTIITNDTNNGRDYTTADVLYALKGDYDDDQKLWAGSGNDKILSMSTYWNSGEWFWLRSPEDVITNVVLVAGPDACVDLDIVNLDNELRPASNLNLTSVIFASAAKAASSDTVEAGTIAEGTAMTLRLDGSSKDMGSVVYDSTQQKILAKKSATATGTVSLVVQGNDGAKDWYYSKAVSGSEILTASDIKTALNLATDVDLTKCKIWIEITDTDGLKYATEAADGEIRTTPSVTAYATKNELMNTFQQDGTNTTIGKIVFGKDYNGSPLEWYILGQDSGVTGENISVFAASSIAIGQKFNSSLGDTYFDYDGTGAGTSVHANHYGASELRAKLQALATNADYFTTAEQNLMQATTIITNDTNNNNRDYTTADVLYALKGDYDDDQKLWAGSGNDKILPMSTYWNSGECFWLRLPFGNSYEYALVAEPDNCVVASCVNNDYELRPASNVNLTSVIFASAAKAASSDAVKAGTIAEGTAMTLRLDGSGKDMGSVVYDSTQQKILAKKSATATGTVSLVVQGNDGANDWYYSKVVSDRSVLSASGIKTALNLATDVDLTKCKIWIETTDTNGLKYATEAADGEIRTTPSVTAYATKDELMNTFQQDGNNTTIGKIVFGKDYNGNPLEWYILGQDSGVTGENVSVFAASPIATGQVFNSSIDEIYFDYDGTGAGTSVHANHYGASELRAKLQALATNADYFTTAEQNLMQATTVITNDIKNSKDYTTTDVLYALKGDWGAANIYAGSNNDKILPMSTYWSRGNGFWLRSPYGSYGSMALVADPGGCVDVYGIGNEFELRLASNLNLASVIFASAAKAASSDTVEAGTIAEGTAMTLRLDGSSKDMGSVVYDSTQQKILAKKSATATGTVSLVVQGNDGAKDWYYSKTVSGSEILTTSDIKTALNLATDVDLTKCKIWIETTDTDGLKYATEAQAGTITEVNNIELTNITAPVKDTALDTTATATTAGLSETAPTVTWKVEDTTVTGNAGYNTAYTAYVTLDTSDAGYWASSVSATVNGNAAAVTANADGTITVSYTFPATEKGVITHTATGYEGTYDGKSHGITVSVTDPADAKITYSTDAGDTKTYSTENPVFTNAGEYTVYYKVEKSNYTTIEGSATVKISRKALTITANDQTITYGESIDETKYSVTGLADGDGINEVTLTPSTGNATDNGSIAVSIDKVVNASGDDVTANYDITCTVGKLVINKAAITHKATGYEGTYDGKSHGITVSVTDPADAKITYSTDEGETKTYSTENPVFTNAGEYTVYYRIEKANYTTIEGSATVKISRKALTITANDQTITYGESIDETKYSETGLADGDSINEVTLTPNTGNVTDNGSIAVSIDKVMNASGEDVTANYDITCTAGKLVIEEKEPVDYKITDGYNSEWTVGDDRNITITGNGAYKDFVGVKIDGELIDTDNYNIKSGSTIVTLKNAYLKTLEKGTHTFEMVWTDGSASTSFTVKEAEAVNPDEPEQPSTEDTNPNNPEMPDTGDNSHINIWLMLLIGSGLMAVGFYRKKRYIVKK